MYSRIYFTTCKCPLPRLYIYMLTILTACEMSGLVHTIVNIKLPTAFEYKLITCTLVLHLLKEIIVQKTWNKKPTECSRVLSAQSCQIVVVPPSNITFETSWLYHELYLCISPCQESFYLHYDFSSQTLNWVESSTSQSPLYSWMLLAYYRHTRANIRRIPFVTCESTNKDQIYFLCTFALL